MSFLLSDDPIPEWEDKAAVEIEPSGIHVWKVRLLDWVREKGEFYSWLSDEEKERAQRIRVDPVRQRFTIAHGVVRKILGCYLHQLPAAIEISATPSGKPFLTGQSSEDNPQLHFNYSHSESLLVLAVSQEFELGIDVEWIQPEIEHTAISRNFFAPEEMSWLQTLAPENQAEAFYRLWTCKEAVLKADGSGLRQSLEAVTIEFTSIKKINRGWQAASKTGSKTWTIQIFKPALEYAAALAYSLEASAANLPETRYLHLIG